MTEPHCDVCESEGKFMIYLKGGPPTSWATHWAALQGLSCMQHVAIVAAILLRKAGLLLETQEQADASDLPR